MISLRRELGRKVFHLSSAFYLAGYLWLGRDAALAWLGAWVVLEGSVLELGRLRAPAFNRRLIALFGGIHREREARGVSGVFWTALGCWLTIALAGTRPAIATAAALHLILGDAAAALAGRFLGGLPLPIPGRVKSLEGSLACLTTCVACGWAIGLPWPAVWAGAAAASAVELAAPPPDDNLWMPLASAAAAMAVL